MEQYAYLAHYGTKGMEWGVRRFQNEDGSLTPAGRERYGVGPSRSKQKVNAAELAVYETGYQVKKLKNKIGASLKGDAKQISKNVKEVVRDRFTEPSRTIRKEAARRARDRQKQERAKAKSQKLEEKKEKLAQKLVDKQNRKTIADLKKMLDDADLNGARREVDRLIEKRDKAKEKALLKEEAKQLKKELKNAKKDAEKEAKEKFSRKKIKSLSDEELNARITRLKKEIELAGLESSRNVPKAVTDFTSAITSAGTEAVKFIAKDTVTALGKEALSSIGLGELVYPSNKRSPWSSEAVNERREQERRVRAYKKSDLTIEEIAQRMNISESKVKDLLYTMNG